MIDLMDKRSVSLELGALASRLKASGDEAAAGRLHQLALAVNGGSYADAWAAMNIHQMIGLDAIITRSKTQKFSTRFIEWCEIFRNGLIFAPLVVTWFYISQAVESYGQYIKNTPDARTPFLSLWQQGFGGRLAGALTLSTMAAIDFAILFVVLGLTLLVHILANIKKENDINDLQGRLMNALAGAALCLTTRKSKQPTNVTDGLRALVDKFDTSTTKVIERMEDLHKLQDTQIKTSTGFSADLKKMFTDLQASINGLNVANTALATNINTTMSTATGRLDALLVKADGAVVLLQQEIGEQRNVLKEQQSWGLLLKDTLDKLERATKAGEAMAVQHEKATKQLGGLLTELVNYQTTFVNNTTRQQASQRQLENDARAIVVHVQAIAAEVDECAKNLKGYTFHMNDLVRRTAALVP